MVVVCLVVVIVVVVVVEVPELCNLIPSRIPNSCHSHWLLLSYMKAQTAVSWQYINKEAVVYT